MKTFVTDALREKQMEEEMRSGIAASESGDKAAAERIFKDIVERNPAALEAWVWLGWTSTDMDNASAAFMKAAALDPQNEEAQLGLRWVASQRDTPMLETAGVGQQQTTAPTLALNQTSPIRSAARHTAPRLSTGPTFMTGPTTGPMIGPTGSGKLAHNTLPNGEWDANALMEQGIASAQAGDKQSAYGIFKQLSERNPNSADVLVWLAGTCPTLEEAEEAFRRAAELDPTNEGANLGLRWVALRRQMLSETSAEGDTNQMPKTARATEAEAEESLETLSFFARLLKRFPMPALLLIGAVVVVCVALIVWLLVSMT